jgi:flagellar export protein FliJ
MRAPPSKKISAPYWRSRDRFPMAFHFSLDVVLRIRAGQERRERLKLEAVLSEKSRLRARLRNLRSEIEESRLRFLKDLAGSMSGAELHLESRRQAGVAALRERLGQQIEELEKLSAAQMRVYVKARQRREAIESLRQSKLSEFQVEQLRGEQQDLDDLFLRRSAVRDDSIADETSAAGATKLPTN